MAFLWDTFVRRAMFRMDAEPAHELGMKALRSGLAAPFYELTATTWQPC